MTHPKPEYHVTVQRKKTVKYGEKQNYEQYVILPVPLCKEHSIETGQIFKIKKGEGGVITLTKVNSKPIGAKITYQDWLHRIKPFIPIVPPGKSPSEICREAGLPLATCPAIWVRQAETDHELERFHDPVTHRIRWARPLKSPQSSPMQKLKETKLTDLPYGGLPLQNQDVGHRLKQAPIGVEVHGSVR
jgi:hypothetical protein